MAVRKITQQRIQAMAATLGRQPGVRKVILFGSQAEGRADQASDIDFLVITAGKPGKAQSSTVLRSQLHDSPAGVDIIVMDEREFDETKEVIGGLAYPASKHGKVVYEEP
ncbi:MAG TPA: nucleotidyltransferase domain-containing protein [Armatimonadota bacterium]|nr:nucleotidyltransferase domain-containing protein [Armatimonadota bacterium]